MSAWLSSGPQIFETSDFNTYISKTTRPILILKNKFDSGTCILEFGKISSLIVKNT